jgi:transcription initiation factor TFIIIB Brf1 subunit/transcription initiation factor TFIIB
VVADGHVLVCQRCGGVVDEHPLDCSSNSRLVRDEEVSYASGVFTYSSHDKGVGSTIVVNYRDLSAKYTNPPVWRALRLLKKRYYGALFRDKCTLEEASMLIHRAYEKLGRELSKPFRVETLVKLAVWIASRRCGNPVDTYTVFGYRRNALRKVLKKLDRYGLLEYYRPAGRTSVLLSTVTQVVNALEEKGAVPADLKGEVVAESMEVIKKLPHTAKKPQIIAAAVVYYVCKRKRLPVSQKIVSEASGVWRKRISTTLSNLRTKGLLE